jgi:hypothetical protein
MEPGLAILILAIARLAVPLAILLTIGTLVERRHKSAQRHA